LGWVAAGGPTVPDWAPDSESVAAGGARASESRPLEYTVRTAEASLRDGAAAACDATEPAPRVALKPVADGRVSVSLDSPIARALRAIDECQARYEAVRDYVCTFSKRERIDGRLTTPHVMFMKARTRPRSVYLKFRQPAAGREAIFIEGR